LTATINNWLPLFTRPEVVNIVHDSWRFLQKDSGFRLYGYVILENHLNLIAASPDLSRDRLLSFLSNTGLFRKLRLQSVVLTIAITPV
jgi:hypothetical protein